MSVSQVIPAGRGTLNPGGCGGGDNSHSSSGPGAVGGPASVAATGSGPGPALFPCRRPGGYGSPSLALLRSVRVDVLRSCAVARWFRAVPRAPLGRVLSFFGAGPVGILRPRSDTLGTTCTGPTEEHRSLRAEIPAHPLPQPGDCARRGVPQTTDSPRWAPLQGRGELRTPVSTRTGTGTPRWGTPGARGTARRRGRPAPEGRPQAGSIQGRGELRTPVSTRTGTGTPRWGTPGAQGGPGVLVTRGAGRGRGGVLLPRP